MRGRGVEDGGEGGAYWGILTNTEVRPGERRDAPACPDFPPLPPPQAIAVNQAYAGFSGSLFYSSNATTPFAPCGWWSDSCAFPSQQVRRQAAAGEGQPLKAVPPPSPPSSGTSPSLAARRPCCSLTTATRPRPSPSPSPQCPAWRGCRTRLQCATSGRTPTCRRPQEHSRRPLSARATRPSCASPRRPRLSEQGFRVGSLWVAPQPGSQTPQKYPAPCVEHGTCLFCSVFCSTLALPFTWHQPRSPSYPYVRLNNQTLDVDLPRLNSIRDPDLCNHVSTSGQLQAPCGHPHLNFDVLLRPVASNHCHACKEYQITAGEGTHYTRPLHAAHHVGIDNGSHVIIGRGSFENRCVTKIEQYLSLIMPSHAAVPFQQRKRRTRAARRMLCSFPGTASQPCSPPGNSCHLTGRYLAGRVAYGRCCGTHASTIARFCSRKVALTPVIYPAELARLLNAPSRLHLPGGTEQRLPMQPL